MPTPDDYDYDPGQRPYYTPAAYRPPPTPGELITSGAVPGLITNRARGEPTPFARQLVAAGVNPPTEPPSNVPPPPAQSQQPPTPAQPAFPGVTAAPPPATPPRGSWAPQATKPLTPTLTPPSLNIGVPQVTASPQNPLFWGPAPLTPYQPQIQRYATEYGVPPQLLSLLARAESNFDPNATGPMTKYGQARGVMQFIPQTASLYGITNPYSPDESIRGGAEYLRRLYEKTHSWAGAVAEYNGIKNGNIDASQYVKSPDGRQLIAFAKALDGGKVAAGPLVPPPQNYRPVSYTPQGGYPSMFPDRPPSQWGRDTPDMFEDTPGNLPHEREFGGILRGLAPFLMIGLALFSKGAAMPMLSAFAGYQNARNKRQEKDAELLRTKFQDQLKELKAKIGIEQIAYGGAGSDTTELRRLATEFGDDPLLAILNNGGDPTALFQQRDKAFQDTSKLSYSAERLQLSKDEFAATQEWRAAQQERANATSERAQKAAEAKEKAAKDKIDEINRQRKALGEPPVSSAPEDDGSSREDGGEDGGGEDGGGIGEQGAATPPASAAQPALASAPAPIAAAPSPSPASAPAPQPPAAPTREAVAPTRDPNIIPASFSGAPIASAPAPAPGERPAPAPAPSAPAAAPAAAPANPLAGLTPQEVDIAREVLNGAEMPKLPSSQAEAQTKITSAIAGLNRQLRDVADNPKIGAGDADSVINAVHQIDPLTADMLASIIHNKSGLPGVGGGSGGSARNLGYRNVMTALAEKANPKWDPGQWEAVNSWRKDSSPQRKALGRIVAIADAGERLKTDLAQIKDDPVLFKRMLDQFNAQAFTDDPAYSNLFQDWQTFIIDSNALTQGGSGLEGETEQIIKSIPLYGQKGAYVGALIRHSSFALSRYGQYQNEWAQLQRTDPMFGHNDAAANTLGDLENTTRDQVAYAKDAKAPTWADPNTQARMFKGKKIWAKRDGSGWFYSDGTEAK